MKTRSQERIALAADVPLVEAQALFQKISAHVGVVKVGLSLFVEHGPEAVRVFQHAGARVFLDLKLHDIPNTVELAARRAAELGVAFLTIHASGGESMMKAAVAGAAEGASRSGKPAPQLLAVTVLTSLSGAELHHVGLAGTPEDAVLRLAELAQRSGVTGLVCSPREARRLREKLGPSMFLCTPGIRFEGGERHDQTRAESPRFALESGSNLLVVGRPIYGAVDPLGAARALHGEVDAF